MKSKLMLLLCVGILLINLITCSYAETYYFNVDYANVSVENIAELVCFENQTTIFHIKRLNYNSNLDPVNVNYIQKTYFENILIENNNISKNINSYTKSNTGKINFNNNGEYKLTFEINNQSFEWNYDIDFCTNDSNEINISLNNTINISINETDSNNTDSNNTNINNTNNELNNSETEFEFNINTNKLLYQNAEKVTIYFNNVYSKDFKIVYWIEDLFEKVVKDKYTTYNDNSKSYTPKIDEKEKIFVVKAKYFENTSNEEYETYYKYFFVKNDDYDYLEGNVEEENNNEEENVLIINEIDFDETNSKLYLDITIEKNIGTKRVLYFYVVDENNNKISDKIKLELFDYSKNSMCMFIFLEKNKEEEVNAKLIVEGLDLDVEKSIFLNSDEGIKENNLIIEKNYLKKTYVDDNFTWYVKINGEGKGNLFVISSINEFFNKNITLNGEKTFNFDLKYVPNMSIRTILIDEENKYYENLTYINLIDKNQINNAQIVENKNLKNYNTITANVATEKEITSNENIFMNIKSIILIVILSIGSIIGLFLTKNKQINKKSQILDIKQN